MAGTGKTDRRSDRELVDACNNGDAADASRAFGVLYQRHKDFVIRVASRIVRDNDMALDVLQETFSYLLRKFPPAGEGLSLTAQITSLLYPVARNSAISLMRKAERFPRTTDQEPDDLPAIERAESTEVAALLGDLSAERREIIILRFVDDLSLQEIASALDIPIGTVKSRLHLAIKQLRGMPHLRKMLEP
jgi:RNA polymerase sigma-70 factor (ECF subfamily)